MRSLQFSLMLILISISFVACDSESSLSEEGKELKIYQVKFMDEKTTVTNFTAKEGEKIEKPSDPKKGIYTFAGWYQESTLENVFDFNKTVRKNITLYAKWTINNEQKLLANDKESHDWFGFSVAVDGSTMAVGAKKGEDGDGNTGSGEAYVFTKSGNTWKQSQKLSTSDKQNGDWFGFSVAIDGNTMAVAANRKNSEGKIGNGAVYVFTKSGNSWSQSQILLASDKKNYDDFGNSIAIDGNTIAIGARFEDSDGKTGNGAVYVFTKSGNTWSQSQKILSSNEDNDGNFGYSVAMEGNTMVIGAVREDKDGLGGKKDNGIVYVFTKSDNTWSQSQKLVASDKDTADYFGSSVAMDGNTIVIGAYNENKAGGHNNNGSGAVYVFTKSGDTWSQSQKLIASDREDGSGDWFGFSIAIEDSTIVVGAKFESSDGKTRNGAVYLFKKNGNAWSQSQKILASDKQSGDSFGSSVAIENSTIFVGASLEDNNGKNDSGAVYVYEE